MLHKNYKKTIAALMVGAISQLYAQHIAFIHGDVAADGTTPSGNAEPYDQLLITDTGNTGTSQFRQRAEAVGLTFSQHYDQETTLNANFLNQFDVVIFNLNQKIYSDAEKDALHAWLTNGGGMFIYSDSASGGSFRIVGGANPVGQRVTNNLIRRYGMEVTVDQGGGVIANRSGSANTPVVGNLILEGEGVSPVAVDPNANVDILIHYETNIVSGSVSLGRQQNTTINNPTYAALANAPVGNGNVMVMYDRQPMWNNGAGSDINERDNSEILVNIMEFLGSNNNTPAAFIPDPNKLYHIENPTHGLRLAATGNSENAYTTNLSVNNDDTRWRFIQSSTNGLWHVQRAAGGNTPRLRTDITLNPDMQATSSSGVNTQFSITESPTAGTYLFTVPNANTDLQRFRILSNGGLDFATNNNEGVNPSLRIIEASTEKVVRIVKRNAQPYALHCNESSNGGNVNIHRHQTHSNLQWKEIDRGNGFYSYERVNSTHAIDGGNGGKGGQNIYVWTTNANNFNQQWQKVSTGGGSFQLRKRNSTGFCINGGGSGTNLQNVTLFNSSNTSQNLQWFIQEQ